MSARLLTRIDGAVPDCAVAPAPRLNEAVHPAGMHSMFKVDGVWSCACGERRDRFGKPLPQESP